MNSLICALAASVATYGACQAQLDNPDGRWLLIAGALIIILTMVREWVDHDPTN